MHVGRIATERRLSLMKELLLLLLLLQIERFSCSRLFSFLFLLLPLLKLLLMLRCPDAFDLALRTESAECGGGEVA